MLKRSTCWAVRCNPSSEKVPVTVVSHVPVPHAVVYEGYPCRATKFAPARGPVNSEKSNGSQYRGSPGLKSTVCGVNVTISGSELEVEPIDMPHVAPVSDTGV